MKFANDTVKYYWRRTQYFCVHNILHADDPPQSLAMGIAIGVFVAFLPVIGVKMALSVALAWMLRANKAVGVPLVWISNPLTAVPMLYPGYWLGCKLLNVPVSNEWMQLLKFDGDWHAWMQKLADSLSEFVAPLCLGATVVALLLGVACYYASLFAIKSYRMRRWGQLLPPKKTRPVKKQKSSPSIGTLKVGSL